MGHFLIAPSLPVGEIPIIRHLCALGCRGDENGGASLLNDRSPAFYHALAVFACSKLSKRRGAEIRIKLVLKAKQLKDVPAVLSLSVILVLRLSYRTYFFPPFAHSDARSLCTHPEQW